MITRTVILYILATLALSGVVAAWKRLRSRVELDDAERTLREDDAAGWK